MKINPKVVLFHVFGWLVFLVLPLLLLPVPPGQMRLVYGNFLPEYLLSAVFLGLYFYFNYSIAIPYLLLRRKTFFFLLANV